MDAPAVSLIGGVMLGLASSLHCIGMCGGISLLLGSPAIGRPSALFLADQLALQGGCVLSYAALGGLAGGIGGAALGGLDAASGHALLRWAAALSFGWVGLSLAGLMPSPAILGRLLPLRRIGAVTGWRVAGPVRGIASGLVWGLLPCGMVYGALLFALFAGSAAGGAVVMLGFGLGTLPTLIGAGWGIGALRSRIGERSFGLILVVIAAASMVEPEAGIGRLCRAAGRLFLF